ncbi:acyl-CoA synthetase [Endozoicomonas sp. G2_1]|uniref:acyl-CoA synthetase n=1 Tax=Endozoicomonas sp. G2_1 TaxID=2821091 RepID=UPI001ADA3EBF|nr:acyl-CoA synthetase [Endozoicomonas sp. G2_1]MBO9491660.1 acyl-CoA synthetase [Endozoicomonas sp. G2_1]
MNNSNLESLNDVVAVEQTAYEQQNVPKTTYDVFAKSAKDFSQKTAMAFFIDVDNYQQPHQVSYQTLFEQINRTANTFRRFGVERGDVVAFVLPNLPETHYVIWGGEAAGIVMSLNPLLEAKQLSSLISSANAKYLVCLAPTPGLDIWEKCVKAVEHNKQLKGIFTVSLSNYLPALKGTITKGFSAFKNLTGEKLPIPVFDFAKECAKANGEQLDFTPPTSDDIASYFCTGGTTGLPKIARRSHSSESYNAWAIRQMFNGEFTEDLNIFCGLPLFHVNGQIVTGLAPWSAGATVTLGTPQGYRAPGLVENFWKIVEHYKVNMFSGVPTLYAALVNLPTEGRDLSSLSKAICGAAPLPKELYRKFLSTTGVPLVEGYGLTEGTCASSINPGLSDENVGSIGFRLPYQAMAAFVLDDDGNYLRDAAPDEVGAIAIKGPNVFAGYVEAKHNEGIWLERDGETWLNTGDLGRQDERGYFWLTGRKKELIIRGGHNIDPKTIEEAMHQHPKVSLAAAVGRPDAYAGELPVLYVELNAGEQVEDGELMDFAQSHIAEKAAWPKKITVLDKLPVTPVGKLFKPALNQLEVESVVQQVVTEQGCELRSLEVRQDTKHGMMADISLKNANDKQADLEKALSLFAFAYQIN